MPDPDKHHDCALSVSVPADSLPHLKDMAIHRVKKFLLTRVFRDFQKRVECVDRETVTVGFPQKERYLRPPVTMLAISMALDGTGGDACSMGDCFGYHRGRR